MVADIPGALSDFKFNMSAILICLGYSQIFEICNTFEGCIAYIYVVILKWTTYILLVKFFSFYIYL
jgi:hypothetical protein